MVVRKRTFLLVGLMAVVLGLWVFLALNCPSAGIAITPQKWKEHRLKNRTGFPNAADFDLNVTLDALLKPGEDRNRWSTDRAARVQGLVIDVAYAGVEGANCLNPCRRDIHVVIAKRKGAPKSEQVVIEVTPNLRDWAAQQGMDWSEQTLQAQLVDHWCEFEGWLYFDEGHADESENKSPGKADNWRATAWEVHPITKITVIR